MPNNSIDYDFFTKQDIGICLNKKTNIYKVTILTNSPLLFYQVWNKSGSGNNSRFANEEYLNDFVKIFLDYNLKNQIKYAPTTVIDFGDSLHVLVMTNVKQDKKGRTVFYFAKNSVEIRNKIQLIDSKLPIGKFSNVRFDIDSINCEGCVADGTFNPPEPTPPIPRAAVNGDSGVKLEGFMPIMQVGPGLYRPPLYN